MDPHFRMGNAGWRFKGCGGATDWIYFRVERRCGSIATAERTAHEPCDGGSECSIGVNPAMPDGDFLLRTRQLTP